MVLRSLLHAELVGETSALHQDPPQTTKERDPDLSSSMFFFASLFNL